MLDHRPGGVSKRATDIKMGLIFKIWFKKGPLFESQRHMPTQINLSGFPSPPPSQRGYEVQMKLLNITHLLWNLSVNLSQGVYGLQMEPIDIILYYVFSTVCMHSAIV